MCGLGICLALSAGREETHKEKRTRRKGELNTEMRIVVRTQASHIEVPGFDSRLKLLISAFLLMQILECGGVALLAVLISTMHVGDLVWCHFLATLVSGE